ncbi:MAG TPA: ABC transporter ATP-binding protein [Thermotogota bacterium]|nr:ABC transporter ATP-binding protein [Thermotogota bacterium]HRW35014.1 ABC transporter ATP-binding protein [Thermotogota bacterium]
MLERRISEKESGSIGAEKKALVIKGLDKVYKGDVHAVKEIDFDVNEGEVHALLGPNGAGKTTTIKSVLGFIHYQGDIRVFNEKIDDVRPNVAFVPEDKSFYEFMTPEMAIKVCTRIVDQFDPNRAFDFMRRFSLPMKKKIKGFSHGMKTSLYLSLCLAQKASLYIFDEPTWGLDPIRRDDVLEIIRNLVIDGKTVLYTSHIISEVEKIADRISILFDGRILFSGYTDDIKADFRVFYLPLDEQLPNHYQFLSSQKDREKLVILTADEKTIHFLRQAEQAEEVVPNLEMFFQTLLRGKHYA